MNYYGAFYRSALHPFLERINAYLMRWIREKYKRLRGRKKAQDAWTKAVQQRPRFFAHWASDLRKFVSPRSSDLGLL